MDEYVPSPEVIELSQDHEMRLHQLENAVSQLIFGVIAKASKIKVNPQELIDDLTEAARDIGFTMQHYPSGAAGREQVLSE